MGPHKQQSGPIEASNRPIRRCLKNPTKTKILENFVESFGVESLDYQPVQRVVGKCRLLNRRANYRR